jgi:hypothetical protein
MKVIYLKAKYSIKKHKEELLEIITELKDEFKNGFYFTFMTNSQFNSLKKIKKFQTKNNLSKNNSNLSLSISNSTEKKISDHKKPSNNILFIIIPIDHLQNISQKVSESSNQKIFSGVSIKILDLSKIELGTPLNRLNNKQLFIKRCLLCKKALNIFDFYKNTYEEKLPISHFGFYLIKQSNNSKSFNQFIKAYTDYLLDYLNLSKIEINKINLIVKKEQKKYILSIKHLKQDPLFKEKIKLPIHNLLESAILFHAFFSALGTDFAEEIILTFSQSEFFEKK